MICRICFAAIACLLCSTAARAQEFERPGPEHKKLQELQGAWDAVMDMEGQKSKGSAVYKSICGGMWLQSDFEGNVAGIPFQGHGLDGYDLKRKKYIGTWVDSLSSSTMQSEGNFDPDSKLLVMSGESLGPDGKPQKFKNTTEFKDKDHFTFKLYMVQADGKDQLAFTIDYTRRK